jgi:hypothetical protein
MNNTGETITILDTAATLGEEEFPTEIDTFTFDEGPNHLNPDRVFPSEVEAITRQQRRREEREKVKLEQKFQSLDLGTEVPVEQQEWDHLENRPLTEEEKKEKYSREWAAVTLTKDKPPRMYIKRFFHENLSAARYVAEVMNSKKIMEEFNIWDCSLVNTPTGGMEQFFTMIKQELPKIITDRQTTVQQDALWKEKQVLGDQ